MTTDNADNEIQHAKIAKSMISMHLHMSTKRYNPYTPDSLPYHIGFNLQPLSKNFNFADFYPLQTPKNLQHFPPIIHTLLSALHFALIIHQLSSLTINFLSIYSKNMQIALQFQYFSLILQRLFYQDRQSPGYLSSFTGN